MTQGFLLGLIIGFLAARDWDNLWKPHEKAHILLPGR
jgi:hypothetical protein